MPNKVGHRNSGSVSDVKSEINVFEIEDQSKEDLKVIQEKEADVTLRILEKYEEEAGPLTVELEKKLKRKLWLTIFPVVFAVNFILFFDKNAMGFSYLLGMWEDCNLDQAKYNNLQTIFYVGYLVGQIPSHFVFQKLPLSKYVTLATFFWAFTNLIQLTASKFSHLAAIRFFLGVFESGITPCLEHTIAMWFTPEEQAIVNPIFWVSCLAQGIPGGLISYGVQFVHGVRPWKVYWSIIGGLSAVVCLASFFIFPDNPASYRFFTVTERVHVIQRIKKATNSSIEQKVIKKEQIFEALKDPITWGFALFVLLNMLCNNISFQSTIIYKQLGITTLDSTLVAVASAGWSTVLSIIGTIALKYFRGQTAHVSTCFCLIALLGGLICVGLPLSKNYGILAGIFLTNANGITFIAAFSWAQSSAAGYTKRLVRTMVWSISYAVVNLFASQIWRAKDAPRYYLAWAIQIVGSWFLSPLILQVIRYILAKRNKERKQILNNIANGEIPDESGFVTEIDGNGNKIEKEVDISMLDLTDLENKKFIYPL